jgi:hypothetical protein
MLRVGKLGSVIFEDLLDGGGGISETLEDGLDLGKLFSHIFFEINGTLEDSLDLWIFSHI